MSTHAWQIQKCLKWKIQKDTLQNRKYSSTKYQTQITKWCSLFPAPRPTLSIELHAQLLLLLRLFGSQSISITFSQDLLSPRHWSTTVWGRCVGNCSQAYGQWQLSAIFAQLASGRYAFQIYGLLVFSYLCMTIGMSSLRHLRNFPLSYNALTAKYAVSHDSSTIPH